MPARVISFHYTLTDPDGKKLDSSQGREPMSFLEGVGQIIPGLESALGKMSPGDKQQVKVAAENAYGDRDEDRVFKVPIDKMPTPDVKVGEQFRAGDEERTAVVTVVEVEEDKVTLDGNHPLAGVDLTFDVEVTEVRDATEVELEHGHVHGPGGAHH
jgi:FKBP-type peptidyl-prolyl cis-trans isomerase SlyD